MKEQITNKWKAWPRFHKLWVLAFIQIWVWPQVFDAQMSVGYALSMFITMMICVMYNVIQLTNAYDEQR